jgi:hypothetical protein
MHKLEEKAGQFEHLAAMSVDGQANAKWIGTHGRRFGCGSRSEVT